MYKTIREVYLDVLTELVKEESPTLYLDDFLYYYNKAINEYLNLRYEKFEITQQLTDDLRPWKREYIATEDETKNLVINIDNIVGSDNEMNYRHTLNCVISVKLRRPVRHCEQSAGTSKKYKVTRSTSERDAGIVDNVYLEPKFYRPYFNIKGDSIVIDAGAVDTKKVDVTSITLDYLTQPKGVTLTEDVIFNEAADGSQVLEFPINVSNEITKRAVILILERDGNPRLQGNTVSNQTVNDIGAGMSQQVGK